MKQDRDSLLRVARMAIERSGALYAATTIGSAQPDTIIRLEAAARQLEVATAAFAAAGSEAQ
jgi:hypothetical protein